MPKPFFENKDKKLQEIIRVNHAGEFGAAAIYRGQIRYTKNPSDIKLLTHMLEQEQEHLDYFSDKIKDGLSRPTIFMPIWKIAGYLMGGISAKIGIKSAMLVTENVETVIETHYQEQIDYLKKFDAKNPMLAKIKKFQADEIDHKNEASRHCEPSQMAWQSQQEGKMLVTSPGIAASVKAHLLAMTSYGFHHRHNVFSNLIQTACRVAIYLSKRF